MKKLSVVLLLSVLMVFSVCASDFLEAESRVRSISNPKELKLALSGLELTDNEKIGLMMSCRKKVAVPFTLNFALGFGIGSFVQKDYTGGVVALAGELAALAAFTMTTVYAPVAEMAGDASTATSLRNAAMISLAGLAVVRIYECARPFMYAKEYNNALFDSVASARTPSVALVPVIEDGELRCCLSARVCF